jgi:hypothetical protein
MILPDKRRANIETILLEVRHMLGPKFFYLGILNSVSKLTFLNMCDLQMNKEPLRPAGYSRLSVEGHAKTLVRPVLAHESPR